MKLQEVEAVRAHSPQADIYCCSCHASRYLFRSGNPFCEKLIQKKGEQRNLQVDIKQGGATKELTMGDA